MSEVKWICLLPLLAIVIVVFWFAIEHYPTEMLILAIFALIGIAIYYLSKLREKRLEERRRLEEAKRREQFEKEQMAKGLVKFVDRLGRERWGTPEQVREWKIVDIGMRDHFAKYSPREFERFIAELFTKMGFKVELGPGVKDFGADIIAKRGTDSVVIQVKKWRTGHNIGAKEVQKALGSMWKFKANKAIIITTSDFTIYAEEQAKGAPIELWNYRILCEMIENYILKF